MSANHPLVSILIISISISCRTYLRLLSSRNFVSPSPEPGTTLPFACQEVSVQLVLRDELFVYWLEVASLEWIIEKSQTDLSIHIDQFYAGIRPACCHLTIAEVDRLDLLRRQVEMVLTILLFKHHLESIVCHLKPSYNVDFSPVCFYHGDEFSELANILQQIPEQF